MNKFETLVNLNKDMSKSLKISNEEFSYCTKDSFQIQYVSNIEKFTYDNLTFLQYNLHKNSVDDFSKIFNFNIITNKKYKDIITSLNELFNNLNVYFYSNKEGVLTVCIE